MQSKNNDKTSHHELHISLTIHIGKSLSAEPIGLPSDCETFDKSAVNIYEKADIVDNLESF